MTSCGGSSALRTLAEGTPGQAPAVDRLSGGRERRADRGLTGVIAAAERRPAPPLRGLALGLAYGALAAAVTAVGDFGDGPGSAASFWPAAGVTVVVLVRSPRRYWPWLLPGVWAAEAAVDLVLIGTAFSVAAGWGVANCVEPLVAAILLQRFVGPGLTLRRRDHLRRFLLFAVLVGPAAGALAGGTTVAITGTGPFGVTLLRWLVGDAVGVLVVAPAVLAHADRRRGAHAPSPSTVAVVVVGTLLAFAPQLELRRLALPYLILPAVVWLALRERGRAAADAVVAIALAVDVATILGVGTFAAIDGRGIEIAQMFLGITAFSALIVSSLAGELVDREELGARLRTQATHDPLTGLPNRVLLLERLGDARGQAGPTALVFIDLDDFKYVNDSYGHQAGDELLKTVTRRLEGSVRPGDLLARVGGDEFALLLEGDHALEPESTARRLATAVDQPCMVGGRRIRVTASIGIASTADGTPRRDLLRCADVAMYQAKATGKGGVAVHDVGMTAAYVERVRVDADLQSAIARQEFEARWQPIVETASGRIVGAEALVRWHHPERGLLLPGAFVPAAERSGAIVEIGRWILGEACRQGAAWREDLAGGSPFVVSVNISARQLERPDMVDMVAAALADSGLHPGRLRLEITETGVLANPGEARDRARALRDLGVGLAIDDFGTGYASLTYLRHLYAGTVKIDKSFVDGLGSELEDTTIVAAVIGLAHAMGITVTAEGVETAEQMLLLRDMGCEHVQGYYLSRPLPAAGMTRLLEANRMGAPLAIPPATSPAADADVGALLASVPTAPGPARYRVVVVDDDADDRFLQRRELEATGRFDVVGEAGDGEEALDLVALHQPHLVLLDLAMPKVDGLTALPRILLAAPGTKVVLVSGHASPGAVDRALAIGATGFHKKGVANLAAELLTLVEAA